MGGASVKILFGSTSLSRLRHDNRSAILWEVLHVAGRLPGDRRHGDACWPHHVPCYLGQWRSWERV